MIGIDIVDLNRFEKFLKKDKALKKFLSDEEIALITSSQSAAGFFAAKEAISKALGTGIGRECAFKDIIIHKDDLGSPYFTLKKEIVEKFQITGCDLSISHDGGLVIAVAYIDSSKMKNRPLFH